VALYCGNSDVAKAIATSFHCDCDKAAYRKDPRRVHSPLEEEPRCACRAPPLNVNVTNDYGYTPLHVACRHHDIEMVRSFF
jgi:ankyrin repeat protein